jgi:inosose dehydratase
MSQRRVFGTDLGTFMHPAFWGATSRAEVGAAAERDPRPYWDRILETAAAAGLGTLELTVPPSDVHTAIRAYDSLAGLADALRAHGLGIYCSYFAGLEEAQDLQDKSVQRTVVERAVGEATVLKKLGAEFLVLGLPPYPEGTSSPVAPQLISDVAALANRIGNAVAGEGLRVALHTEAYSVFWKAVDVASLLDATDPQLVGFCPDAGHIALAGDDPADLLSRHRDRYLMAHWKDTTEVAPEEAVSRDELFGWLAEVFVPPGSGIVAWHRWIAELEKVSDMSTVILEIDEAPDPIAALTSAKDYINALRDGDAA